MNTIADLRKEYKLQSLSEKDVLPDPFAQFGKWWDEALKADIGEINAMTLASASADGMPDARIVLLKGFDERGFTFFTNYHSSKGQQLLENPRACLVFGTMIIREESKSPFIESFQQYDACIGHAI